MSKRKPSSYKLSIGKEWGKSGDVRAIRMPVWAKEEIWNILTKKVGEGEWIMEDGNIKGSRGILEVKIHGIMDKWNKELKNDPEWEDIDMLLVDILNTVREYELGMENVK